MCSFFLWADEAQAAAAAPSAAGGQAFSPAPPPATRRRYADAGGCEGPSGSQPPRASMHAPPAAPRPGTCYKCGRGLLGLQNI